MSCENERANRTLKYRKTFVRSSMGKTILSALALMHIHYNFPVVLDDVDSFIIMCNRRMAL